MDVPPSKLLLNLFWLFHVSALTVLSGCRTEAVMMLTAYSSHDIYCISLETPCGHFNKVRNVFIFTLGL